ncbi:MAG: anthranilate synthase component I family protein [Cardiobacteriaceae bacterium]|nr:anthranilate synthase component I family protein [Cardiobacteriaceae bacterium]
MELPDKENLRCSTPAETLNYWEPASNGPVWLFEDQTHKRPTLISFGIRLRVSVFVGHIDIADTDGLLREGVAEAVKKHEPNDPWSLFDFILEEKSVSKATKETPALFYFSFESTHSDENVDYPPGVSKGTLLAELVIPQKTFETNSQEELVHLKHRYFLYKQAGRSHFPRKTFTEHRNLPSGTPPDSYVNAFQKISSHIYQGDAYQVVLSASSRQSKRPKSWQLYQLMTAGKAVPYGFVWPLSGERTLVGASPECFAFSDGRNLQLRPLAGTLKRSRNDERDRIALETFMSNAKERGEHMMLLDLCRDDIASSCSPGSVRVESEFEIEQYSHVFHFASQVTGCLPSGFKPFETMRKVFPAGTMTGTPRLRAMEIIASVEPEARGFYAGIVGYARNDGRFDSGICIRTVELSPSGALTRAGGGVVWGSSLAKEWDEINTKMAGSVEALGELNENYSY